MNRIFKAAMLLMAMMIIAVIAFGDNNNGNVGASSQSCVQITAVDPTTNPNYIVDRATITYRFKDTYGWGDWDTKSDISIYGGVIEFPKVCANLSGPYQQIEYVLRAYARNGSVLVKTHCGIAYLNGTLTTIHVTTWNSCGGTPHPPDETTD